MINIKRFLQLILTIFALSFVAFPQTQTEEKRFERLGGLARVWGAVKYFHPYLATRAVDWDKALIETIPRVNAAKNATEYRAAIGQMLAVLNDKNTFVEIENAVKIDSKINPNKPELVRLSDGVLIIEAMTIGETAAADQSEERAAYQKISSLITQAKAVVLDCRTKNAVKIEDTEMVSFTFDEVLRNIVAMLTDQPVKLASSRYRMHNGYAPQNNYTSDYYSSLITTAPRIIPAGGEKTLPAAVIINAETPSQGEIFSGFQATRNALVIQEGEAGTEPGVRSYRMDLPDGARVSMRTTELVNPDGTIGFQADVVVPKSDSGDAAFAEALKNIRENTLSRTHNRLSTVESPQASLDAAYEDMKFPAAEYRMLALFRYWNILNYFYPYKNLIGASWETILPRYIPKFEANKTALEYQTTVRELATEMHDSHGFVRGTGEFDDNLGLFVPPALFKLVEGQTIVAKVLDDKANLKRGEVILTIDGEPVEKRRAIFSKITAASTQQALDNSIDLNLLRGQKDSTAKLSVRDAQGKTRQIELARTLSLRDPKYFQSTLRTSPTVEVLPNGFGYVDLARLEAGEVGDMFEKIKQTPAVIFDMRGYPNGTAWAIVPRLTDKSVVGAQFSRRIVEATNLGSTDYAVTNYAFEQYMPKPGGDVYKGKIVMLIDNSAISQAEHTCLFFEAARPDIAFIGTATKGANGDVTNMILPGGIMINFSGHDVRHADGRQLQRIGIQPTIKVEPTIGGITAGKDEILDAAIKFLQKSKK
ncbi:MAG: S41 family peptidase [Pyrinomonadaceae bacterium]